MKANSASWILLIFLFSAVLQGCSSKSGQGQIRIDLWYGDHQEFGALGLPQKWINVLGNASATHGILEIGYSLNGAEKKEVTIGPDLHRLAKEGDFNIDLDIDECSQGDNHLLIKVQDSLGNYYSKNVLISVDKRKTWPLPYELKWGEVQNIQDVVQVVDGKWFVTHDGIRNRDVYYDRVLAFGDRSWTNYEVQTTVIFHSFTPPVKGPPTYNVTHAAIATRWPGHDFDDLQPHRKWYPLGATAEFRLTAGLDSCRWRIFDGPKPESKNFHVEEPFANFRKIMLNKVYRMKHRVVTIGMDSTKYSVKLWPAEDEEPVEWDFEGIEAAENVSSGSALLLAHHTEVTFGDIRVLPIKSY